MIDEADDSAYAETRDWRTYFSGQLEGDGIDIGALHRPMVKHSLMNVKYVDRLTKAELQEHYPELREFDLVEADIIDDAQTLDSIENSSLDFVIAAHVIEHMRDPIGAIINWLRVLKTGGQLYLVVPDKRKIFDAPRARTTLAHLVNDYELGQCIDTAERTLDFQHALDYAVHVDKKVAPTEAIDHAEHLLDSGYSFHYHCFIPKDIKELLKWISVNATPLKILEGPIMGKDDSEFHVLIEKI